MSQPSSTPATNNPGQPGPASPAARGPNAPPPPSFRSGTTVMGTVLSKLGPILLVLLALVVGALFLLKNQEDKVDTLNDRLSQKIMNAEKNEEQQAKIDALTALLGNAEFKDHPYLADVRIKLINDYYDIIISFDSTTVTSLQQRNDYKQKAYALAGEVIARPIVDQRTLIAHFKRGQLEEDDHDYNKAIADYQGAADAAASSQVAMAAMSHLMSYRIACCQFQTLSSVPAAEKDELKAKVRKSLDDAERSDAVKNAYFEQINFLRRAVAPANDLLTKATGLAPRSEVDVGAPIAPVKPAGAEMPPAPAPAPAPAAPAGNAPVVPAAPPAPPAAPAPVAPAPAPVAPAPAPAPAAPAPAPAPHN